jgi:hypothetical protein
MQPPLIVPAWRRNQHVDAAGSANPRVSDE